FLPVQEIVQVRGMGEMLGQLRPGLVAGPAQFVDTIEDDLANVDCLFRFHWFIPFEPSTVEGLRTARQGGAIRLVGFIQARASSVAGCINGIPPAASPVRGADTLWASPVARVACEAASRTASGKARQ